MRYFITTECTVDGYPEQPTTEEVSKEDALIMFPTLKNGASVSLWSDIKEGEYAHGVTYTLKIETPSPLNNKGEKIIHKEW